MISVEPNPAGTRAWRGLLIVCLACAVLHWVGLGSHGLSMSEGHRAIPAWELLNSSKGSTVGWGWVPRMFEQAYLRKPPGMMWAIAASSSVLGEAAFAARAVSALAAGIAAVLATLFAGRWFGVRHAWLAGLALTAAPAFLEPARSAEIESLHNLGCLAASLAAIDLALVGKGRVLMGVLGSLGLVIALLTKGPAGLPAIAAAAGAGVWFASNDRRFAAGRVLIGLAAGIAIAAALLGIVAAKAAAVRDAGETIVTQSPGEFLWDSSKILSILSLVPVGLAVGLGGSFSVLPALLAKGNDTSTRIARALAWATITALVAYTISGVSNPRYTMPATLACSTMLPWMIDVLCARAVNRERAASRAVAILGIVLVVAGGTVAWNAEKLRGGTGQRGSGQAAGADLGRVLADLAADQSVIVFANDAIEARPEVLWEAMSVAKAAGKDVRVRWLPPGSKSTPNSPPPPPPPLPPNTRTVWLRRVDHESLESGWKVGKPLWTGLVGKYWFELNRSNSSDN